MAHFPTNKRDLAALLNAPRTGRDERSDESGSGVWLRLNKSKGNTPSDHSWVLRWKGEKFPLGDGAMSLADARAAAIGVRAKGKTLAELRAENNAKRAATAVAPKGPTFAELAATYLEHSAASVRDSSHETRVRELGIAAAVWGKREPKTITSPEALRLLADRAVRRPVDDPKAKHKFTGGKHSARHMHSTLTAFFNWAVAMGYMPYSPVNRGIKKPEVAPRNRVLSSAEIRALWAATLNGRIGPVIGAAIRFALLTGLRSCEVAALSRAHLRNIDTSAPYIELPVGLMKGKRVHRLPLLPMAAAIVREQLAQAPEGSSAVFPGRDGACINEKSINQAIQRCRFPVAEGEVNFVVHDLRRTVATRLDELGVALSVAEAIQAHKAQGVHSAVYIVRNEARDLREKAAALQLLEAHLVDVVAGRDNVIVAGWAMSA